MKNPRKFSLIIAALMIFASLAGCGGGSSGSESVTQVRQELAQITNVISDYAAATISASTSSTALSSSLGGEAASIRDLLIDLRNSMAPYFDYYEVRTYRVTYWLPGYSEPLSGLVAVPRDLLNPERTLRLPMISLQHPTQVLRSQSPSLVPPFEDEELTVPFGTMLAAMGYIVLIPDYPGLGVNHEIHPYCLTRLAEPVTGLIAAVTGGNSPWSAGAAWDGRLFLLGFSEGGYATLVTAGEIQEHHPEWNLVGVAALDGPYSLSGTMREVMLSADAAFPAPYFLPYTVAAYGAAYGATAPLLQFDQAVLPSLSGRLYSMLFGDYSGEQINSAMQQATPYAGPKSILTAGYLAALGDAGSQLVQRLAENDAFRGWTPQVTTKVLLYHDNNDDLVPIGNLETVRSAWGNLPNVAYEPVSAALPGLGSVHAGALVPAYLRGMRWIESLASP